MELCIRDLSKSYSMGADKFIALDRVNLDVESGEFICLVGPSGCGKSTLLNMIAGLEPISKGSIVLNGDEIKGPGPDRAMIFQDPALFPWLNVIENVEFGMKQAGLEKKIRRDKAMAYLSMVHLSDFAKASIHTLSGGMKQRVSLARALSLDSKMLLMDEPFAALDTQTREILYQELYEIWKATKKTVVFVTHQVEEAVLLADRIMVMTRNPGKIQAEFKLTTNPIREITDSEVSNTIIQIKSILKEEVSKFAQKEYDGECLG